MQGSSEAMAPPNPWLSVIGTDYSKTNGYSLAGSLIYEPAPDQSYLAVSQAFLEIVFDWVAVKVLQLSCHKSELPLFCSYPYYGNLRCPDLPKHLN